MFDRTKICSSTTDIPMERELLTHRTYKGREFSAIDVSAIEL